MRVTREPQNVPEATGRCATSAPFIRGGGSTSNLGSSRILEGSRARMFRMSSFEDLESQAMKLGPRDRARLAGKLLESLEELGDEENERLWAKEAQRRDRTWGAGDAPPRSAQDVLKDARGQMK